MGDVKNAAAAVEEELEGDSQGNRLSCVAQGREVKPQCRPGEAGDKLEVHVEVRQVLEEASEVSVRDPLLCFLSVRLRVQPLRLGVIT